MVAVVVLVAVASLVPPVGASQGSSEDVCTEVNSPGQPSFYVEPGDPGYQSNPVEPTTLPGDVPAELSGPTYGNHEFAPREQFGGYAGDGETRHYFRTAYGGDASAGERAFAGQDTEVVLDCSLLVDSGDSTATADANWIAAVELEASSPLFYLSPVEIDPTASDGTDELNSREAPIRPDGSDDEWPAEKSAVASKGPEAGVVPGVRDDESRFSGSHGVVDDEPGVIPGVGHDASSLDVVPSRIVESHEKTDDAGVLSEPGSTGSFEARHRSAGTHGAVQDRAGSGMFEELPRPERPARDPPREAAPGVDAAESDALELAANVPVNGPLVPTAGGIWLLSLLGIGVLVVRKVGDRVVNSSRLPSPAGLEPASSNGTTGTGSAGQRTTGADETGDASDEQEAPDSRGTDDLGVDESSVPDKDHAPNDYVVERLLESAGGRLKQGHIVEATGWSKSKVSRVISAMDEAGTVVKVQLGRENVICLDGHEPDLVS